MEGRGNVKEEYQGIFQLAACAVRKGPITCCGNSEEIKRNMSPCAEHVAAATQKFPEVDLILEKYDHQPARLTLILQAIQDEYRYLPMEVLSHVIEELDIPATKVFGVVSFYAHFTLEPRGKYVIRLCDGTACHVKRSIPILEALYEKLGLSSKKVTSPDMLFTIETVSCLGACGLAPVMLINEEVYGRVTPASAVALIDEIIAKEAHA